MRDVNIPYRDRSGVGSNPALARIAESPEMRAIMLAKAEQAQALYQAEVAKRTGRLARSARTETFKGGPYGRQDRWCGRLIVDAPYALPHEFGRGIHSQPPTNGVALAADDLNRVLNQLGSF